MTDVNGLALVVPSAGAIRDGGLNAPGYRTRFRQPFTFSGD